MRMEDDRLRTIQPRGLFLQHGGTFLIVIAQPAIRQIYIAMTSHKAIESDKLCKYRVTFVFDF